MCGIAGLIEAPGTLVDPGALRGLRDALVHRGPDDGRSWRGEIEHGLGHVGLAHRRLSILDHAGGVQPMIDTVDAGKRERFVLVFNGQIYNHLGIRKELVDAGARFRSDHSDTEALLHALRMRLWGERGVVDVCARLSGMFAFAAVDLERRVLVLARDAMGKKPLYVAGREFFDDGKPRIAFASELVALETLPHAKREIDPRALARYFAFDFVPDPDCIYDGVLKLEPGHVVEVPLDDPAAWSTSSLRARAVSFRDLSFTRATPAATHEGRVEQLRRAIEDAVEARMVADVPVGIFLSGGIDSSLVAALAKKRSANVETFSIAFRGDASEESYDESRFARIVAKHIASVHHEEVLDQRALLDVMPKISAHLSEPFADHSVIPTFLLSTFARKSVTVALGGDGGDELFLGYPTFQAERARPPFFDHVVDRAAPLLRSVRYAARRLPVSHDEMSLDFKLQRTLDGLEEKRPLRRHQRFLTGATDAAVRALLSVRARGALGAGDDLLALLDVLEDRARRAGARDVFDVLQYGYAKTYMAAGVLQKVDRASMAASLEVRAPLLDNAVVDLAFALPSSEKLRRFTTKAILKDVADTVLPREIVHRKKKGFGIPVAAWLAGPLRPVVMDLLSPRAIEEDGFLHAPTVTQLVDEHMSKRANHRKQLWSILMYRLWRTRRVPGGSVTGEPGSAR